MRVAPIHTLTQYGIESVGPNGFLETNACVAIQIFWL